MTKLTISQALRTVKSLKGRIGELKGRAAQAVSHEKGTEPAFAFSDLRKDIAAAKEKLIGLETAVAVANALARIDAEGRTMTLAEAIRRLQELKDDLTFFQGLELREGVQSAGGYEWDELARSRVQREREFVSALKERERVAEIDRLRDCFERLNNVVEQANHKTPVEWTDG
jgi:cysteinyl-tRNA synthetase